MNLKNLKIGTQLKLSLAAMMLFVIILGTRAYIQSNQIHQQLDILFNHPFKVQRALGGLKSDILAIHRDMKDLSLTSDSKEMAVEKDWIKWWKTEAGSYIDILYSQYLGPRSDVDSVNIAFLDLVSACDETNRLVGLGKNQEVYRRTKTFGIIGSKVEILLDKLQTIDKYSLKKSDELYDKSEKMRLSLNLQLISLIVAILLLSLLINYILLRNIHRPLDAIISATGRFQNGDLNSRSSYVSSNEFGVLSASFNTLASNIQLKTELNEKVTGIAALMLSKYEAREFFRETISALALNTGSQMAAIYLLSEDKKSFEHFESIGVDDNARQSFSAVGLEGEFGLALSSHKVQIIKTIPEDTRFIFHSVSGRFIPCEIITIPIFTNEEVLAVISLASVHPYTDQAIQLIDSIFNILQARVEGILAFHKIRIFSEKLELQNHELETQKEELLFQSAELMKQNIELAAQKKQLADATRLKTNFLSNMSHELRTPLNSVIALSGVLNKRLAGMIPVEEYSYLEVIKRNGQHLLALINDILDISRIEAGREDLEISRFNINDLMNDVISMINPQAKQKNIELLFTKSDADIFITSDMGKCHHILQNIIGNAVKFTEKGKVEVKARQSGNKLEFLITDTGIGITEDQIPHIFEEFRQADSSTSRRFGGTGLGLALARKYASFLGGSVNVNSTIGKGSEFTFTLPLNFTGVKSISDNGRADASLFAAKYNMHYTESDNSTKTILLVEDSEPAIIQITDLLEESGFKILLAHDGKEALESIKHTVPDAMILDLMMPGIDGFQVLKSVRESEQTTHIPVLILTAKHITKDELIFLKENNIHQIIQKGDINGEELKKALRVMVKIPAEWEEQIRLKNKSINSKPIVLIVEDNPDNMMAAKAVLADDFTILEATDGLKAVEMAKLHIPDLILMDIELPGINGIDAFNNIRKIPELNHVIVIALTASAMAQDQETILAHGFDAFIAKPIEEKIFFKTINKTLYGD